VARYFYADSLSAGVLDWSWATHSLQATAYTHANSLYSVSFEADYWAGVLFKCDTCVDNTMHSGVELYVAGGANAGQQLRAYLITVENGNTVPIGEAVSIDVGSDWSRVFLDATQLTKPVSGFIIQGTVGADQPTVYIDDVAVLLK